MATRLQLYKRALRILKERRISSLSEKQESRYLLDEVWDEGGVRACLSNGHWNFAMRTIQIEYTSSLEPDFGFTRAFVKPSDWVRTSALCGDEFFLNPLQGYADEASYWFADLDTLYVKYVSDDSSYGNDLSLWTEGFFDYAAHYFAAEIQGSLTSSESKEINLDQRLKKALANAKSEDGQNEPSRPTPQGSWSKARTIGRRNRWER